MNACLRTVLVGFVAGALSVLVFHQLGFWIANELGYARAPLYSLRPVPPFGVPAILSLAFWGGLWGIPFGLPAGTTKMAPAGGGTCRFTPSYSRSSPSGGRKKRMSRWWVMAGAWSSEAGTALL